MSRNLEFTYVTCDPTKEYMLSLDEPTKPVYWGKVVIAYMERYKEAATVVTMSEGKIRFLLGTSGSITELVAQGCKVLGKYGAPQIPELLVNRNFFKGPWRNLGNGRIRVCYWKDVCVEVEGEDADAVTAYARYTITRMVAEKMITYVKLDNAPPLGKVLEVLATKETEEIARNYPEYFMYLMIHRGPATDVKAEFVNGELFMNGYPVRNILRHFKEDDMRVVLRHITLPDSVPSVVSAVMRDDIVKAVADYARSKGIRFIVDLKHPSYGDDEPTITTFRRVAVAEIVSHALRIPDAYVKDVIVNEVEPLNSVVVIFPTEVRSPRASAFPRLVALLAAAELIGCSTTRSGELLCPVKAFIDDMTGEMRLRVHGDTTKILTEMYSKQRDVVLSAATKVVYALSIDPDQLPEQVVASAAEKMLRSILFSEGAVFTPDEARVLASLREGYRAVGRVYESVVNALMILVEALKKGRRLRKCCRSTSNVAAHAATPYEL